MMKLYFEILQKCYNNIKLLLHNTKTIDNKIKKLDTKEKKITNDNIGRF